jgi:hypothetical protein
VNLIDVRDDLGATPEDEDTQRALGILEHQLDTALDGRDGSPESQDRIQKAYTAWVAGSRNADAAAWEAWGLTWGAR